MSSRQPCQPGPRPAVKFRRLRAYVRALPAGTIMFAGIAAVASIALFLAPNGLADGKSTRAYAFGTAVAVVTWLLLPSLFRRYAYVDRSNPTSYSQLVEVYSALRLRVQCVPLDGDACAVDEACEHLKYVGRQLGLYDDGEEPSSGLRWLLATGYVDLWRHLHRCEEALLLVEPPAHLIGGAVYDDLRLDGSKIAAANHLRMKLRAAVGLLDNNAVNFLNPAPTGLEQPVVLTTGSVAPARAVLRSLRRTINEFRDDRREGLVRARNNLYATVIFAGLVAYLLLGLAMLTGVSRQAIIAAAAFYLVGAVVGLFRQLRAASAADMATEEDFGLSTARLIHTPLFSGIAAVAGAALVRILPETLQDATTTTPGQTPRTQTDPATLTDFFDLSQWPQGVIYAAVFGLAPTLLITSLQRRAEQFKEDLKTSEAGEGTSKSS